MTESKVMKELRETRDRISKEIKDLSTEQMKDYFKGRSFHMLNEIKRIRAIKSKAL